VLAGSYHNVLPEMRALAGSLITPKAFMRFTWEVLDPLVFPPVDFRYEDLGEDRICIGAHLRPGVKPCEVYFAASTGAVLGMMQHLGLPPVEILSVDVAPDHGIWDMRLPPARTIVHRITRSIMRFVIGSESDGTPIHATLGSPEADPLHARLEHATAQWKLTPRQAEVLALVVAGKANKEIAHSLECADNTVELHVTRVLRKSKLTSRNQLIARFWSADWGFPL
jgi:DNA-binding CsgD family transcriptional regulator